MYFSLLVVNYNTESFIKQLLESLQKQVLPADKFEIILVNNVQNDTLANMIDQHNFNHYLQIKLLQAQENLGFGRAMNLAATEAVAEHFLITNPDITIDNPNFLQDFYLALQHDPHYGVATCQILGNQGKDNSEFYHYGFNQTLGYDSQICWFYGCFLSVRQQVFQQINGFDDDFFMYCEDIDLCYRIKKMGLSFYKINSLQVHHVGNASEPNKDYAYYLRVNRSRFLFAYKHYDQPLFQAIVKKQKAKAKKVILKYKLLGMMKLLTPKRKAKLCNWQVICDIIEDIERSKDTLYYFQDSHNSVVGKSGMV